MQQASLLKLHLIDPEHLDDIVDALRLHTYLKYFIFVFQPWDESAEVCA